MGAAPCCPRAGPGAFREDLVKSHAMWLSCNQERLKGPNLRPRNPYSYPLCSLSLLPWDLVRGCLADFLIHPSSFSPPYSPWVLPHRLQFPYFTLTLSGFRKNCPTVCVLDKPPGEGFQRVPSPLVSASQSTAQSLSSPCIVSVFPLVFSESIQIPGTEVPAAGSPCLQHPVFLFSSVTCRF